MGLVMSDILWVLVLFLGFVAVVAFLYISGKRKGVAQRKAEEDAERQRANDVARKVDEELNGMSPSAKRERLTRWSNTP